MFICTHCDAQSSKWSGKCLTCDHWGTIKEQDEEAKQSSFSVSKQNGRAKETTSLDNLKNQNEQTRLITNDSEIDRVLGGGIVKGSLILISGEPGIGKSTLVAAIASCLERSVLYISGEESGAQLKTRFDRLKSNTSKITFLEMCVLEDLIATIEKQKPDLVIVDSVQTLFSGAIDSQSGSTTMVRYATSCLMELAKRTSISILLVGQVTKDGSVAGPKTLEHLVDTVLSLEGDPSHEFRLLIAKKNRFGATDEIGVFEMTQNGLIAVSNPSEKFLEERKAVPGSVITAIREGSRIFLVEVQALVEKSFYGTPVRRANGFDQNRLQMLIAILSKRAGLRLGETDVYVNVVGGMELKEPSADLAVCAAIISATTNQKDEFPTVYVGEVGLGGEVRSVNQIEKRLQEAERIGITHAVIPKMKNVKSAISTRVVETVKEISQ